MSNVNRVTEWRASGELNEELEQLSAILTARQFTREQVVICVDTVLVPIYICLGRDLGKDPTLEEFRTRMGQLLTERTELIEQCMLALDDSALTKAELFAEAMQVIRNRRWSAENDPAE